MPRSERKWFGIAFGAIVCLAAALRFVGLERYPLPVNQDELSNIYDGWSIAETGADRYGRTWPVLCRGFGIGDSRPALYAWLFAPIAKFTGFSVAWGRSVAAVAGVLTVVLAGLWVRSATGNAAALLAMLLVSITPWSLMYSRIAHEGASLPGLFCVAILLAVRLAASRELPSARGWGLVGVTAGLSTNAYAATRLTGLLFTILAAVVLVVRAQQARVGVRRTAVCLLVLAVGAALGAAPQFAAWWDEPNAFLRRAQNEALTFHGVGDALVVLASNVWANFKPRYLFGGLSDFNNLTVARCLAMTAPCVAVGVLALFLPRTGWCWVDRVMLIGGLFISSVPAALTDRYAHALRASGCAVLLPVIAVVGFVQIGRWAVRLGSRWTGKARAIVMSPRTAAVVWGLFGAACVVEAGALIQRYCLSPVRRGDGYQNPMVECARWLREHGQGYDRICIEPKAQQMDLYIAAFTGIHPSEFSRARRATAVLRDGIEVCNRFNQYAFMDRASAVQEWNASHRAEKWLLIDPERSFTVVLRE